MVSLIDCPEFGMFVDLYTQSKAATAGLENTNCESAESKAEIECQGSFSDFELGKCRTDLGNVGSGAHADYHLA